MTISAIMRRAGQLAVDHSPTILTSVGVVGAITTAYLAGKASFEAADIINLRENLEGSTAENDKELFVERVKLVWKMYIPAATMGAATVVCIIGANRIGSRRYAAMAAVTTIAEKSFDEYKNKVIEKFGEKKEEQVRAEVAQDRLTANATYLDDVKLVDAAAGELCYDKWSDRYFRNSYEGIKAAENGLNFRLIHDNYATLDELYQELNLPSPAYAHHIGWNSDQKLDIKITTGMAPGDRPCLVIDFKPEPGPDYGRFH